MPASITYEEAAACLEGAFYASWITRLQSKAGQKELVYGASGAIASSYVQFLIYFGVYITAVCGAENAALVRSLGADCKYRQR